MHLQPNREQIRDNYTKQEEKEINKNFLPKATSLLLVELTIQQLNYCLDLRAFQISNSAIGFGIPLKLFDQSLSASDFLGNVIYHLGRLCKSLAQSLDA
jgi:hypothetical protein